MLRADFNRTSSHIYFQDKNNSSFCKQNSAWQRIFTEEKDGILTREGGDSGRWVINKTFDN